MSKINTQVEQVTIELHPLPEKWVWSSLGDIGLVQLGKTPRKSDYRNSGEYKIIKFRDIDKSGNIDWDKEDKGYVDSSDEIRSTLKKLENFDVLVTASAHMSEHIGKKVGIVITIPSKYKEAYVVGEILQIRTNKEIEPKWVLYYLGSSEGYKAIQRRVHGVHLIASRARNIEIPLAPPEQQIQIVAEIEKQFSRLNKAVANLKRVKANLKRYKAAVLKAAVEGKLTEEWRKANPDIETADKLLERILNERRKKWEENELSKIKAKGNEPKDDKWKTKYKEACGPEIEDLPPIPESWTWATLPQLGELNRGKSKHRPRNDPILYGGQYPFVQTGDVRHSTGHIREFSQTYSDEGLKQSRIWPMGTLCITIAANIADTAILSFDSCFPDSVVGFIPDTDSIDVNFIEYFIRTAKENLERYAPATAQKNINLAILSDVAVPVPPEKEQKLIIQEIESRLSVAEEIEKELDNNVKRAERLRQSILSKAFSGQLLRSKKLAESELDSAVVA